MSMLMNTPFAPYLRKVQFYETDAMGIIHHANYIRWFEESRVDFMEKMGFPYFNAVKAGIDFALLSVSCEYKSQVRFGDTVSVQVGITEFTPTRMTIIYNIFDSITKALRTIGESKHCYFSSDRQRPISLKKELPELFEKFLGVINKD